MKSLKSKPLSSVKSRSREGAWIEICPEVAEKILAEVAPVRERGLKSAIYLRSDVKQRCRSREGAWIEIGNGHESKQQLRVAPVRERG